MSIPNWSTSFHSHSVINH